MNFDSYYTLRECEMTVYSSETSDDSKLIPATQFVNSADGPKMDLQIRNMSPGHGPIRQNTTE
jgi:hypothetical protein